jgi:hypothetical protein
MSSGQEITAANQPLAKRSVEVLYRINILKESMMDNFFEIGELLTESFEGNYHEAWGCSSFNLWVERDSGLDIGWRQARYLVMITQRSRQMGYTRDDLKSIKISKLKEIFALKDEQKIRELMGEAENMPLEELREKVQVARHGEGSPIFTHMNFKMTKDAKNIVEMAFEDIRMEFGNTINSQTGEMEDLSDSRCLELLAAERLSGSKFNHQP